MGNIELNNDLKLSYPDGFHVMTEEELKKYKYFEGAPGFCIEDPERHIIISVSWRQANPFVAMIAGTADVARNMEARIRKPMKKFGPVGQERKQFLLYPQLFQRRAQGREPGCA